MIPVFEQAKTVHPLDRMATVIGHCQVTTLHISTSNIIQGDPTSEYIGNVVLGVPAPHDVFIFQELVLKLINQIR
jgi:hypothetical protein